MKRDFLKKPTIQGDRVLLRPFDETDIDFLLQILDEPNLKKLTGSVDNDSEANRRANRYERQETIDWYRTRNQQDERLDLAVVHKPSGELAGEVVFNDYDESTGNVNFRVLLSEKFCNQGIGTEAISLFIKYGMEVLKFHKINLEVFSFNPRAERVYQKVGFILEGVKREEFCYNGKYVDTKLYAMLQLDYNKLETK